MKTLGLNSRARQQSRGVAIATVEERETGRNMKNMYRGEQDEGSKCTIGSA